MQQKIETLHTDAFVMLLQNSSVIPEEDSGICANRFTLPTDTANSSKSERGYIFLKLFFLWGGGGIFLGIIVVLIRSHMFV